MRTIYETTYHPRGETTEVVNLIMRHVGYESNTGYGLFVESTLHLEHAHSLFWLKERGQGEGGRHSCTEQLILGKEETTTHGTYLRVFLQCRLSEQWTAFAG